MSVRRSVRSATSGFTGSGSEPSIAR
jgi:hypothetical protein